LVDLILEDEKLKKANMSSTFNRPKLLWTTPGTGDRSFNMRMLKDATWAVSYSFSTKDSSRVYIQAGNKEYVLSGSSKSEHDPNRNVVSEASLLKKYK